MKRALLGVALLMASTTACGLEVNAALPFDVRPGSIRPVPELADVDITVGSKDFTEQIILGYIAELALEAAGANAIDLTNISGSNSSRYALLDGQVDMAPAGCPISARTSRSRRRRPSTTPCPRPTWRRTGSCGCRIRRSTTPTRSRPPRPTPPSTT
jgi:hypothetical protein